MKNIIIVALILCANARASQMSQFTNFVKTAIGFYDLSIRDNNLQRFKLQKPHQLVQEPFPEEEPYAEEEGPAPPEEPYVPEEEPYLPEEDPNLPEQPYLPEGGSVLPQEDPNLPEQPFEETPESW